MGYAASQDIFTNRFGGAVDDLIQARVTEDCLITASDRQMFLKRLDRFFSRCKEKGIVLNTKKFQKGPEVIFGGFKLNSEGYSLDPSLHDAIRKFPPPTNITQLRSFMGLINQTATFNKKISTLAKPIADLLKKNSEYVWTADHQEAFEKAREELSNTSQLTYFDHRRPTRLYTDASRLNGLGFVVKQLQEDQHWKIVQAGSRFLTSAETRYAMVELELLGIAWAMQKARPFLEGIHFEVLTDHKPLIPILNDYSLADIENKRLQRLKMKMDGFTFEAFHVPGKENIEADALSRAPVNQPTEEDEIDEEEGSTSRTSLEKLNSIEVEPDCWIFNTEMAEFECCMIDKLTEDIREASEEDEDYRIVRGWVCEKYPPPAETVSKRVSSYYKEVERFSIDKDGLLCYEDRLVIPRKLRSRYIDHLVHLHASPTKMLARARRSVWWPGMSKDIQARWRQCRTCVERSPSNKPLPTRPRPIVEYPFQVVHMDLGAYAGDQWLIIVDQFSGFPIVKNLANNATTKTVTKYLRIMFQDFGLPQQIFSDGGPQFTSDEFSTFCKEWQIENVTSSPHYPQSNGIAENGVKAMKKLIHCCYDPNKKNVDADQWLKAIMIYKNTPRGPSGLAPSEILFGKLLRDGLPECLKSYIPKHQAAIQRRRDEVDRYLGQMYEFRKSTKKAKMSTGDRVFIQDPQSKEWKHTGTIEKKGQNEREFFIRTDRGGLWRRNVKFLKLQDPTRRNQGTPPKQENNWNKTSRTSEETSRSREESSEPVSKPKPKGRPKGSKNRSVRFEEPARRSSRERHQTQRYGY